MKAWTWMTISLAFLCVSCGKVEGIATSQPPANMVGAWEESSTANQNNTQDDCSKVKMGKGTVSTGLFMVNEFGNVYDGKNMKELDQPYRMIGQMDSEGHVIPNDVGRREFLGAFADATGGTFTPIVNASFGIDAYKGDYISLKIDLQMISGGTTKTEPWKTVEYFKLNTAAEQALIGKAQKCLTKAKATP